MASNTSQSPTKNLQGKEEWSKLYGTPITDEEYAEICRNLKGFFEVLQQWNKAELSFTPTEV